MNRLSYRLVFNRSLGALVAVAECARGRGKSSASGARGATATASATLLGSVLLAAPAWAELPVAASNFASHGQAGLQQSGNQLLVNQVGNKSILNWQKFNISAGSGVQFRQVNNLTDNQLVNGASFTSLNRIHDIKPSVIAGSITQGAGQKANVILVNTNGIAFMNGAQVNLNSFTASSLDIADKYITDNLLPGDDQPQFVGTGGFVKVFEGAKITAGEQGRVMLIAPTVVNQGELSAAGGQVVLAAGTKAYLRSASAYGDEDVRGLMVEVDSPAGLNGYEEANTGVVDGELDGRAVALTNPAHDRLGNATNLGQLTATTGNVTMVGLAVNQMGIARATTSVVANGSVYLMAGDTYQSPGAANLTAQGSRTTNAGRVVLGEGSLTEVTPELGDDTTSQDWQLTVGEKKIYQSDLELKSKVKIVGEDVRLAGGSTVRATSGVVDIAAVESLRDLDGQGVNPFKTAGVDQVSDTARVHLADGAVIDVAGVAGVDISTARNTVAVELRGDELKDTPVNRNGALRGKTVYLDVEQTLQRAEKGESTLVAADSLLSYRGRLGRTVAERSTTGGSVNVRSQGETILEGGASIDLSGGSIDYQGAIVKSTLLTAGGRLVEAGQASADVAYDGIATQWVIDYNRWNKRETINLGEYTRYDTGYTEGKSAGALNVVGMAGTVLQAGVAARTVVGERQRAAGVQPKGGRLAVGTGAVEGDYKNFQKLRIGQAYPQLPSGFDFGDTLAADFRNNLYINTALLGTDKIAGLTVYTNQDAVVEQAVKLPDGGSMAITARSVAVQADVQAFGGDIAFNARANTADPAQVVQAESANVVIAPGVTLSTAGEWTNEKLGLGKPAIDLPVVDGGTVTISATGSATLSEGARIDVSAGAWQQPDGTLVFGNGGTVNLEANADVKAESPQPGRVVLDGEVLGYGFGAGGTINLSSGSVQIGGDAGAQANALYLTPEWFSAGGFENIHLTGREGVTLAADTLLAPQLLSRQFDQGFTSVDGLITQPSGADLGTFSTLSVKPVQDRNPVNIELSADSHALGDITLADGSVMALDAGGTLSLDAAHQISLLGSVQAHGGTIEARLSAPTDKAFDATSSIWLGEAATLDVSGTAVVYDNAAGLTVGQVLDGGTVSLNASTGYVIAREGSVVDVSGTPPTRLALLNEDGGLGRTLASSAGSVSVAAREGVVLDGSLRAQAGASDRAGGSLSVILGNDSPPTGGLGFPTAASVLSLETAVTAQADALRVGDAVPASFSDASRLDVNRLEGAGFEQMAFSSKNTLRLNEGVAIGADRALALRSVTLDAPRLELAGEAASVSAAKVQLGNASTQRQTASSGAVAGSGVLTVNATNIEVVGKSTLSGMAETRLNAEQQIALTGVAQTATQRPLGSLTTAGDLVMRAQVVTPSTYSNFTVSAPGQAVRFEQAPGTAAQPLSAFGRLRVEADDIRQAGSLWAPFGQIELDASGDLTLASGSLTSVAAQAGSLLPFGSVLNGRDWTYASGIVLDDLPEKSVSLEGQQVDFQSGAHVSVAGGGDVQAYEFTVGPGGSRDILDVLEKPGTYAVLPGYAGSTAPSDGQSSGDVAAGAAIHLTGVKGLADGVYTLLPAHYALLPGAYAVRVGQVEQTVLPGQGYTRQDGTQVVAGFLTDTRAGAPQQGDWQGVQVLSRAQVLDRSEFTLTKGSSFFADSRFAPQDAGRLSVVSQGTGLDALRLDGTVATQAASGGAGASVDIAATNLLVGATAAQVDGDQSWVSSDWLNALDADSLLIGATRTRNDSGAELTVLAQSLTLDNAGQAALAAPEVMLAAQDTLTLAEGSRIDAQGAGGDMGQYTTAGNGAFVRAGSASASFARTGSPDRSAGTLSGNGSIVAAQAITVDATQENAFGGTLNFARNGVAVDGELGVGAPRITFGTPAQTTDGIVFSQAELDGLQDLDSLTLSSYTSFDFHGNVSVGGLDEAQQPLIRSLTLQGGGLAGFGAAGDTASLRARELTLTNTTAGVAFATPAGQSLGSGALAVQAKTLVLGDGAKQVQGFGAVTVAADELVAAGQAGASTTIAADTTLQLERITGETGAHQALTVAGHALAVRSAQPGAALADNGAMGATWALQADTLRFDTQADLRGGVLSLTATHGDLTLGEAADIDVSGRTVAFFDEVRSIGGGSVALASTTGDVVAQGDADGAARINVSGAAGSDAGSLTVKATQGVAVLEPAELIGQTTANADGAKGSGASVDIDAGSLANFSALNEGLNEGGFSQARTLRARTGNLTVAASDVVAAHKVKLTADAGALTVAGTVSASGEEAGEVQLNGRSVTLTGTAQVQARASQAGAEGGRVGIAAATAATEAAAADASRNLDLQAGSVVDVGGGADGVGGQIHLRAQQKGNDVAVTALAGRLVGAREVNLEAVEVYDNKTTLNASTTSSGTTLGLGKIKSDNTAYAANHGNIKTRLGKTGDAAFHMLSGVEVRSGGDMTLGADWNLGGATQAASAAAGGEAGVLTLRTGGNLNINNNLSDGFSHATANTTATGSTPATLLDASVRGGRSWSLNLVAGADSGSADVMAVNASDTRGDVSLAAGKLVRTGSGDIRIAAGRDVVLKAATSAIYTAGTGYTPPSGFAVPSLAQFSQGGGDVEVRAERDVLGAASTQLYSNWLYRQGKLAADGSSYAANAQPAWWVRFDKFQQGVATLGGGDVSISAGGQVSNLSASAATQGYTTAATADADAAVRTGGGDVTVAAAGDVLSGQYYADRGDVKIRAGGRVGSGHAVSGRPVHTILAVGDGAIDVSAVGDVGIHAILNPHLVVQSSGTGGNAPNAASNQLSYFSTYAKDSAAQLMSVTGDVALFGGGATVSSTQAQALTNVYKTPLTLNNLNVYLLSVLPPSLSMVAASGDVSVLSNTLLSPAAQGNLELLAQGDVNLAARMTLSDTVALPNAVRPTTVIGGSSNAFNAATQTKPALAHAAVPVHEGDGQPVLVQAVQGSILGSNDVLKTAKRVDVRAGQDIVNLPMDIQHVSADDVSTIEAGRDVTPRSERNSSNAISVSGPGRLDITAGRNINLGASAGVLSRGTLDNPNLPDGGADLHLAAGVGTTGLDYAGAIARLGTALASDGVDDKTLWLARWLAGDDSLTLAQAREAVQQVAAADPDTQRAQVRDMLFNGVLQTGRASNVAGTPENPNPYAGDFSRAYQALETVFPGMGRSLETGAYQGSIDVFASRIKTEQGGNIELLVPGGGIIVGLSNTPAALIDTSGKSGKDAGPLGIITVGAGDIRMLARDDVLVNQSRVLTAAGGDILIWSSEGDIDAGKGKKTATAVPPPIIKVEADGSVTQEIQAAASGSGIGALETNGITAGDVDLIAPKGTVNAGDAGIRAGNLNIAAQVVLGADNISVSGSSTGTPVADTSAVTAASSGATAGGDDSASVVQALNQAAADSAKAAQDLAQSLRPYVVRVEVLGYGN